MSSNVKLFSSTMSGAPQCSGTAGSLLAILDACLVTGFGLQTVTTAVVAGGFCTLTVPVTPSMQIGSIALVAGATPAGLNGEQRVTAITANTVVFATAEAAGTATGSITVKMAPAGWLKSFSGTNLAAYKVDPALHPDSTGIFVKVDDTTTVCARVTGFETLSDISTGTGKFPEDVQTAVWVHKSDAASVSVRQWNVVCDDRMVYIGIRFYGTADSLYAPNWWGFGEFASKKSLDPYRFVISGNYSTSAAGAPDATYSLAGTSNISYIYIARSYTGIGAGVNARVWTWPSLYGASGTGVLPYPNGPDSALYACPADLVEASPAQARGVLPGILLIPHALQGKICATASTPYISSVVPGFSGKTIAFLPCMAVGGSGPNWGVVAFDMTGPWEH